MDNVKYIVKNYSENENNKSDNLILDIQRPENLSILDIMV